MKDSEQNSQESDTKISDSFSLISPGVYLGTDGLLYSEWEVRQIREGLTLIEGRSPYSRERLLVSSRTTSG